MKRKDPDMKNYLTLTVSLMLLTGVAAPAIDRATALVRADKGGEALPLLAEAAADAKLTPQEKFNVAVLRAYVETKGDAAAFRTRLKALRTLSDAEGAAGEKKLDADRRYFDRLRQSSLRLLNILRDRRAKAATDVIVALTMEMLQPVELVEYAVRYDGNLPQSAEGAARSDVFDRLPKENRLKMYGAYEPDIHPGAEDHGHSRQLKRLLSEEPYSLAADEPGYERNFAAACDERGLHLYLRCRDPEAWKTAQGLDDDFEYEVSVQPGDLDAARFISGTCAKPSLFGGIEWDTPHPGYRLAMHTLKIDVFAGRDVYFVHALMPWIGATRSVPTDGTRWHALVSGYGHGKGGCLGGSASHEIGHGVHLTFRLSAEDVRKIRLGALRSAAGDYLLTRAKWEKADFWDDPHLGDRAFFAAVVKPLTAELDAAAKDFCANEKELSADEVEKLFEVRFVAWAEFAMNVELAREKYVKDALFAE